jgi:hypothetical protein
MLFTVNKTDDKVKYTGLSNGERMYFRCCGWTEWTGCKSRLRYSYLTPVATPTSKAELMIAAEEMLRDTEAIVLA